MNQIARHDPITLEEKQKWLDALRSGKYQQGYGGLKNATVLGNRYCCLGVACEVWGLKSESKESGNYEFHFPYDVVRVGDFPFDWKIPDELRAKLIEMNDHSGNGFPEIADWIEQNILTAQEVEHDLKDEPSPSRTEWDSFSSAHRE